MRRKVDRRGSAALIGLAFRRHLWSRSTVLAKTSAGTSAALYAHRDIIPTADEFRSSAVGIGPPGV
jgi:hypothetical protein